MNRPVLVIHGGAGRRGADARVVAIRDELARIASDVHQSLVEGESALDAVVEAVRRMEDYPLINAGTGAKLQSDGVARLSASLMDGARQRFSGVINVVGLANPILLCRTLVEERDRVLCGDGAFERAQALGLEEKDVRTPAAIARWRAALDGEGGTVGAVALDLEGHMAAATSTGGRGMEHKGRVSDSCTVAGNFATQSGAAGCTGIGEDIVDGALAVRLVQATEMGNPLERASHNLASRMAEKGWKAGIIAVDATGSWVAPHTTEVMHWHAISADGTRAHGPADPV